MWSQILLSLSQKCVYGKENVVTAILFGIILFVSALYFFGRRRKGKLPPGPFGVPVLGYYPFLGKEPEKTLNKVGKKYGNVFG